MSYLSKVTLNPSLTNKRLFIDEQIQPQRSHHHAPNEASQIAADPYRVHQALWQLFDLPAGSDRPFLYREYQRGGKTFYYLLSTEMPLQQHPFFSIQTKAFNPTFVKGQRLAFELRANPVATVTSEQGRSSRHDVLMMAKKSMIEQGFDDPYSIDQAMYEAGVNWITQPSRMASWGVIIHPNLELTAYTQHKFRRTKKDLETQIDAHAKRSTDSNADMPNISKAKNKSRLIQFSSLDYEGALEIKDPEVFLEQMLKGFGKQKAFGCGLMLVRPLR